MDDTVIDGEDAAQGPGPAGEFGRYELLSLVPILIVAGTLLVGGVYLAYLLVFQRQVLDHEPGQADVTPTAERDDVIAPAFDSRQQLALV